MTLIRKTLVSTSLLAITLGLSYVSMAAPSERALAVSKYWNKERIASAQPRDLALDHRGLAYLKGRDGKLTPYGHNIPATPEPRKGGKSGGGKPGSGDNSGGSGGTGLTDVSNAKWTHGGVVQNAAGRIFFLMNGDGYVCSGTLVDDGETDSDRSVILTAAHCVYDDVNDAFAEAAIFIPNQAGTTGSGTDADCSNDPKGCWVVDFGVVSNGWDAAVFPSNIPDDFAFYAVGTSTDIPAYFTNEGNTEALDRTITPMTVSFDTAPFGEYTRALGYSYKFDPNFMYCGQSVTGSSYGGFTLSSCGLSGGASGGPWSQSQQQDLGTGPIISVNSYGPTRGPSYMGGPMLDGTTDAACLFEAVKTLNNVTNGGKVITCN